MNASSTSSARAFAGTQGSAEATTTTVSRQNAWPIVEPKQMTDPAVSRCIDVARRCGPTICLQLEYIMRSPQTHGSVFWRKLAFVGVVQYGR
jgi:hypothetical protein